MISRKGGITMPGTLTAVIQGDRLESILIRPFLEKMKSIGERLVVISSDGNLLQAALDEKSVVSHIVDQKNLGRGSTSIKSCLAESLRITPEATHILVVDGRSKLPSVSKIASIVASRFDYVHITNCVLLTRRYAQHVLNSEKIPSAANAKSDGFLAPSLVSGLIQFPLATLEENRILKFAMVGASGVLVNEIILSIFKIWITGVALYIGNAIAVEISIVNNFVWNDRFTFRSIEEKGPSSWDKVVRLIKYNLVSLTSTLVNIAVFYYLNSVLGVFYIWSSLAAIAVAFVVNYFGSFRWAWRKVTSINSSRL
jgi:putative flippase GtrA